MDKILESYAEELKACVKVMSVLQPCKDEMLKLIDEVLNEYKKE